ncbi:sperm axonemal maintenance protein CFAP97D1-like [Glandiceps talaboti]
MHRTYQSIQPCQSRILQRKWDQKYYDAHRQKLKEVKASVDNKPPRTYMHIHCKIKTLQMKEERLATIERDNRILLEKMSMIMRTQGRVDNRNNYDYRSLNREKRQKELLRVTKENQEILRRIMASEPEYDHKKWQKDWHENEELIDDISRYPRDWWQQQQRAKENKKKKKQKKRRQEKGAKEKETTSVEESQKEKQQTESEDKDITAKEQSTGDGQEGERDEEKQQNKERMTDDSPKPDPDQDAA